MPDISFDYRSFLKTVPDRPGSYRMYGDENTVIYVGKAKSLKKRLSQYFLKQVNLKTSALIRHIHHIEFTVTFSESEALILENELIKKFQPRYNILLRDDKSYPYLLLTAHRHPGLYMHRGSRRIQGEYFGPFPDATAVHESLKLLQKLFPIRQCADNVYEHRSRPCLMAQIGKCLAPCVAMTPEAEENYTRQVENVRMFLKGRDQDLLNSLSDRMQKLSDAMRFEDAAKVRDQMLALRRVQEQNSISGDVMTDIDVVAHAVREGTACVHVLFIRHGRIIGTRSYYPKITDSDSSSARDHHGRQRRRSGTALQSAYRHERPRGEDPHGGAHGSRQIPAPGQSERRGLPDLAPGLVCHRENPHRGSRARARGKRGEMHGML